jgi:hypothetical protein
MRTNEYIVFDATTVKKGETVVIDGQVNLSPGASVHIVNATNSSQTPVQKTQ